jgi:hypothetical protein
LEVPVGLVTRLRVKRFKEAFNGLLRVTWAKENFKRVINNEEQALINLIHVQEGLVGGTKAITQGLGYKESNQTIWHFFTILIIIGAPSHILMRF